MATVAVMQNSSYLCSRKSYRKHLKACRAKLPWNTGLQKRSASFTVTRNYLMPPRGGHNRGDQYSMTRVTNNQPYEHTIL